MAKIVTYSAYARHRNCSVQAVYNAVKEGRLPAAAVTDPNGVKKLDLEAADSEWSQNTDPAMQQGSIAAKENQAIPADSINVIPPAIDGEGISDKDMEFDDEELELDESGELLKVPAFNRSRAKKEAFNAKMAQLEFRTRAGELVEADEVKKTAFKAGRMVRELIMNIPDRISSELASINDPQRVHVLLSNELRKALETLASGGA